MPVRDDSSSLDTDVIVVGAGPVGLTTAAALRHHGVACRLLEQRSEHKPYSRANNLWARPQELLHSIGLRDLLAKKAYRIDQVNTIIDGHPVDPVAVAEVESPFPNVLYSGQDVIEATLSDEVARRGCPVERGRKVVGIEQDDEGVTITVTEVRDGETVSDAPIERLRCRYLVGADGNEGTVRKSLSLGFETEKLPDRINRQVDARLHWRRSTEPDQLWFFYHHDGFCGVLPVWGGYHRLFFLQNDAGVPDRDPTLDEVEALAREVTGDDTVRLTDPIWFSHSRFQHGHSSHYAKGRVFLAGDAGHTTLPIGGQGMNGGFHDAVGVAWRLAMTLAGRAQPVVLESYDAERGGEHARLDDQQATGFDRIMYRSRVGDLALNLAARTIPDIGSRIQGTDDLQQLSVAYPASPLNDDHLGRLLGLATAAGPVPGERAPDAHVTDQNGNETTLFAHIQNPDGRSWGWSLLLFDGQTEDAGPDLLAALKTAVPWDWVRPRLILAGPLATEVAASSGVILSDLDGRAHSAYGLGDRPALILIRPDGHLAFRGPLDRPELLRRFCETSFGAAAAAAA